MTTAGQVEQEREAALLGAAHAAQAAARSAEVALLEAVLAWAVAHPPLDQADRARFAIPRPGRCEDEVPLNGTGVPEVSAVAVAELAAALGRSTESGRSLVADVLELGYRLPCVWGRVLDGRVPVWQARKIAAATTSLNRLAARWVDSQLGVVVGRIGFAQVERLIVVATARFDQALLREQIQARAEQRRFDVELGQTGLHGLVPVGGVIDLPDAIALDAAIAHAASELTALGSTEALPARRARALGDLAREHLTLWDQQQPCGLVVVDTATGTLTPVEQIPAGELPTKGAGEPTKAAAGEPTTRAAADGEGVAFGLAPVRPSGPASERERRRGSRREIVLHVHLNQPTLTGERGGSPVGRVDNQNLPITAETIRSWCGAAGTKITVLPVLDLAEQIHHGGYEIPTRLREQILARDVTCVYPGCAQPARRCDLDHVIAYDHDDPGAGGQTQTNNLAALCRHHHRLKTTGRIRYQLTAPLVPGGRPGFTWAFPTGLTVTRDHTGTGTGTPHLPASQSGSAGGTLPAEVGGRTLPAEVAGRTLPAESAGSRSSSTTTPPPAREPATAGTRASDPAAASGSAPGSRSASASGSRSASGSGSRSGSASSGIYEPPEP